ncbi:MAG: hypothetical protein U9P11_09530 [Pseudomonadota bacterium]|nr:hypothetical protein [Pseudomonadota bacterium]
MMRIRSLVLALLLAVARLDAAPPATDEKSSSESTQSTERRAVHKTKDRSGKKSSAPARSFNPSEEIGADSAVSFPVDI